MPENHARRREALRELLRAREVDAALVTDLLNVRYLTGFTGSHAALLVPAGDGPPDESGAAFATDGRYEAQAGEQVPDLPRSTESSAPRALAERAGSAGHRRLGLESQHVTVDGWDALAEAAGDVELVRAPGLVEQLREVKDEGEVEALRRACDAADRALADLVAGGGLRAGRTEREVARELENRMVDHGAAGPSFETIVAAGVNSAVPHHRPTEAVLAEGDLVKMDFGALVEGYHSDMTRTVVLGEPRQWQRDLHDLVRRAQAAGREALAAGVGASAVDAAARGVIEEAGRGEEFVHGLGHGVGLQIHEAPALSQRGTGTMAAGMAVTVEPGVYLPGRGGVRIEDTLVVRPSAAELLTLTTKDLVAV